MGMSGRLSKERQPAVCYLGGVLGCLAGMLRRKADVKIVNFLFLFAESLEKVPQHAIIKTYKYRNI
jgi:hypothetical protein